MPSLSDIRAQYPQYSDLSDTQLAEGLHKKYYSDLDFGSFTQKIGLSAPQAPEGPSMARTVLDQGLQGATFGFADEITDRLGAGIASVATGEPYADILKEARSTTKDRMAAEFRESPVTSIAANLAGGLVSGGAGTSTKAGSALANSLRTGGAWARIGKGALAGAASGAAYGAGSADEGSRLEGAGKGAALGGALGAAVPAVGSAFGAVKNQVTPKVSDAVKSTAQLAEKHGIPLGLDQVTGSKARLYMTKAASRVPFSGGNKLAEQQQAAFNRALGKTIGIDADRLTNEVFDTALDNIGAKFDSITSGRVVTVSDDIVNNLKQIASHADDSLDEGLAAVVRRNVEKVLSGIDDGGNISGEKLASLRSSITRNMRSAQAGSKEFLGEVLDTVVDATVDGTPGAREVLTQARQQYKNAIALQPLVAKAADGNVSPALLKGSVLNTFGTKRVARGQAGELGELAKVADLIKSRVGDSGTAETLAAYGVLGGGAVANPAAAAGAVGGAKLYNAYNASQPLVRKALQQTPQASSAIGSGVLPAVIEGQLAAPRPKMPNPSMPQPAKIEPPKPQSSNENDLLNSIAQAESGGNLNAKAKTSSAEGKYQFITSTRNRLINKYGEDYGITQANWKDEKNQDTLAFLLAQENIEALEPALGRTPSKGELYIAHFLGPDGAKKLIKAHGTGKSAASLFPNAALANKSIFYKGSQPRSVEEVYALLERKVS